MRQYLLAAETVQECAQWIDAIKRASFNKLLLQKEQLEQKHLHLLQVGESDYSAEHPGHVETVPGGGEREDS